MVIFGLILLLLALAVIGYMWFATAGMAPVEIDYGILNVSLTPFWLFVAGGIALAVATSGLWLIGVGARSKARKAKEVRELRRQAKEADRRAERASDSAALDRGATTGRASSTQSSRPSTEARTTHPMTSSNPPILPRTPRAPGTDGPAQGRSSLDIDRPKG